MKKTILEKSKLEKEIIGIRRYDDGDNFWCGYVEDFNDQIIQLRHFDKLAFEDGVLIEQLENIECIDFQSDYERTINYISRKRNDFDRIENITNFKNIDTWRTEYLNEFKEKKRLISVEFNLNFVIYGFITNISETDFIINAIDKHGINEGFTVYQIENISAIKISDRECKFREELFAWRI